MQEDYNAATTKCRRISGTRARCSNLYAEDTRRACNVVTTDAMNQHHGNNCREPVNLVETLSDPETFAACLCTCCLGLIAMKL